MISTISGIQGDLQQLFSLLDKGSDEEIREVLDAEFAKHTIAYEKIKIDRDELLGKGGFGEVFKGSFAYQDVAVKIAQVRLCDWGFGMCGSGGWITCFLTRVRLSWQLIYPTPSSPTG